MLALAVVLAPAVAPGSRDHATVELGAVLAVEHDGDLAQGVAVAAEVAADAGELEIGECQRHLGAILDVVLVVVALEPLDGLEGATQLDIEQLGAPEEVAVLIGEHDGGAQVAGRVGALELGVEGVALVGGYGHHGMEPGRVGGVGQHGDAGVHDGPQGREVAVGVLDVLFVVELAGLDGGFDTEHILPHAVARRGAAVRDVADVTDAEPAVGHALCLSPRAVVVDKQGKGHAVVAQGGVGLEADELLVEEVVAAGTQEAVDAVALGVQLVEVERHAHEEARLGRRAVEQMEDARVGDLPVELGHGVAPAGLDKVHGIELEALLLLEQTDLSPQVAHVAHGGLHVVTGLQRLGGVVDDGGLPHALEESVDALGGVGTAQQIGPHGHLEHTEPPRVRMLQNVALHRASGHGLVGAADAHVVEQILVLWYETRHTATCKDEERPKEQQEGEKSAFCHSFRQR